MKITTLGAALRAATPRLAGVSDSPRLDAELLLAHSLAKPRSHLFAHPEAIPEPSQAQRFEALITRRATGEPVAYLTGERAFHALMLQVDARVLVPRPETETLVEQALARIPCDAAWRIADLGTGSGAIALALAHARPACRILATDANADALACAQANAERLQLHNVRFARGDWYAALADARCDMLVSNPPYVAADDPHLDAPAMRFEPRAALIAPDCGHACLRHLIAHAPAHLAAGGHLLLEHGAGQGEFVRAQMAAAGFAAIETSRDLAGHERASAAQANP